MRDVPNFEMIVEIAKRSEDMGIGTGERITRIMDIELAHEKFNLDLEKFLNADGLNFTHDFISIQANIDRPKKVWKDEFFLPRFATNK
jgi:hypothetical protein